MSDIYDRYWESYLHSKERNLWIEAKHLEAVNKSRLCGREELGIAVLSCTGCGDTVYITRSCKHRFCGRCGNADTNKWAQITLSKLINDKHHHVVTTLPKQLRGLAKKNGNLLFDLLFQSSAKILKSWFKSKHNVLPGIVSVLHTAGSDLKFHPHIHMLVSGGGKSLGGEEYKILKQNYLCSQQFLGEQLKIKFRMGLIKLHKSGKLKIHPSLEKKKKFFNWLYNIKQDHWIVSIQKSLEDVEQIVGYVGRYTKRACLSEYKIEAIEPRIKFRFNDYANSQRKGKPKEAIKEMDPHEFLDALLQHVPDKRYQVVRYFGLYNSRHLNKIPDHLKLSRKSETEQQAREFDHHEFELYRQAFINAGKADPLYCPICKQDKILTGIKYKDKFIEATIYEDST